jgi:hypothetical protein
VPRLILKEKPGSGYAVLVLKKNLASAASVLVARTSAAAGVLFPREKPAGSTLAQRRLHESKTSPGLPVLIIYYHFFSKNLQLNYLLLLIISLIIH